MDMFDKLNSHVKQNLRPGQTAGGQKEYYVPAGTLHEFWDVSHIKEILYKTPVQPLLLPITNIRDQYPQTLSIIVYISGSGRSYVRYLELFIQYEKNDDTLPLEEKPAFLPDTPEAKDFFEAFYENQWKFCPVPLGYGKLYKRKLYPRRILPLFREGDDVDSKKIGRETTVYCVKVDPSGLLHVSNPVRNNCPQLIVQSNSSNVRVT